MIRAAEVLVVVEIVSPGSRRTDHVAKRSEYADAGIRTCGWASYSDMAASYDTHTADLVA